MYQDEFSKADLYYVCRFTPGGDADEDYRRHIDGMRAAIKAAAARPEQLTIVIVQDPGYPAPNAHWRQIVAEMTSHPQFKATTAIVTSNALIRGVITALSWLRPRHYKEELWADAAAALAWLEKERGRALPELRACAGRLGVVGEEQRRSAS